VVSDTLTMVSDTLTMVSDTLTMVSDTLTMVSDTLTIKLILLNYTYFRKLLLFQVVK